MRTRRDLGVTMFRQIDERCLGLPHAVSTRCLCGIKRQVCSLEQLSLAVVRVARMSGEADAALDVQHLPAVILRLHLIGYGGHEMFGETKGGFAGHGGTNDGEFLPPDSEHVAPIRSRRPKRLREGDEHTVSHGVAVEVIELLKAVDVCEKDAERPVGAR